MGYAKQVLICATILCHLLLSLPHSYSYSYSTEPHNLPSLVVGQSAMTQLSPGMPVENSPGSKPGASIVCERVLIRGISRLKNLRKIAHSVKVRVSGSNSSIRLPNAEVCFHGNASLGIGMCSQGQWEKMSKGSWARFMSPYDQKFLDIRTASSSLESFEVSIEEEFFPYRIIFLILGIVMLSLASSLSKSLTFYYSSAMLTGVILVILVVLFQGMKLLPTGRKSSFAIFLYSSVVGLGSFLLRKIPGLLRSLLSEIGISEDMYNPLAILLLAFVVLAGAWLGFWVVHKLVLTEEGSIDISTSLFVEWSIRVFAAVLIIQSTADNLLAVEALVFGIIVSQILRKIFRWRFIRRIFRKLKKSLKGDGRRSYIPDSSPFEDALDEYAYNIKSKENFKFLKPQPRNFSVEPSNFSDRGFSTKSRSQLLDTEIFPSSFHMTPERRRFSKDEWEKFTRNSTEKALEELVSSPNFGKWLYKNADRITVTPNTARAKRHWKRFFWS